AHRSTVPDAFARATYTVAPSREKAIGPYASRSGSVRTAAPPHGMVTRGLPSTGAMQATSPRGVHAGAVTPDFGAVMRVLRPASSKTHTAAPSRSATSPAISFPAGDHVACRTSRRPGSAAARVRAIRSYTPQSLGPSNPSVRIRVLSAFH